MKAQPAWRTTPILLALAVLLLVAGALGGAWWGRQRGAGTPLAAAAPAAAERRVLYWYDPMKPTQHFDQPGKSPFMDMALLPRYADETAQAASQGDRLVIAPREQQALGMRLAKVERTRLPATVEAAGTLQFSERDVSIVQARTAGFVERVYPHAPGDVVAAGSPLVDVMNPDWAGAQQEFLAVRAMNDAALAQAARTRLSLLGMPSALIEQVETLGRPVPISTIRAPTAGVIVELAVRQGMALSPGMTLARINGLATIWLELAVPQAQAGALAAGQPVRAQFAALPGAVLRGTIATILPEANVGSATLRVRVELANPGQRLRAGMIAQASLLTDPREVLAVPSDAVIRTGTRALVYLADGAGGFHPVVVEPGVERDGRIEIRSGLLAGQSVVASGQFLVDSEASLRGLRLPDAGDVPLTAGVQP